MIYSTINFLKTLWCSFDDWIFKAQLHTQWLLLLNIILWSPATPTFTCNSVLGCTLLALLYFDFLRCRILSSEKNIRLSWLLFLNIFILYTYFNLNNYKVKVEDCIYALLIKCLGPDQVGITWLQSKFVLQKNDGSANCFSFLRAVWPQMIKR